VFACPPDQYESCVFGICACYPEIGGDVGRTFEQIKKETQAQTEGPILQLWLQGSHDTAVGTSQPIPPEIRQALTGYIEEDIMNRVRFKVGDNGIVNLANVSFSYGDFFTGGGVAAITLIDVVVFRNTSDAYGNPSLWAHELTHVKQFRDWGIRDFSIRYARDAGAVESEAYAVGNNYGAWRVAHSSPQPSPMPWPPAQPNPPQPAGFPSGWGMQVCGCWGFNPALTAPEPRCASGWVRINICQGFCQGGGQPFAYVCQ
jgi:hypothetical protein